MSRGNVIISITFSFSITQTDEKERDTHGFPSIILGRGVARRHGWRWTIGCYPSLKTIPIASVTLTRIFKVCFLSTINSFLPEDVGMRKAIHQLDFVKHVLPVGSQQIHLEHHHLVRGPVSNLFQIIQPVTKENERKTKQEEKHLLGIYTTHNTDDVSSLDNNNNSTHPVVKGLPFLHSDVHLHPTCRFIGLRSNSKKYKEKNLRCSNRLQSSYTHDWVWMTWKTRDREREREEYGRDKMEIRISEKMANIRSLAVTNSVWKSLLSNREIISSILSHSLETFNRFAWCFVHSQSWLDVHLARLQWLL